MDKNFNKYASEFFGTLFLVLIGCGSFVIGGPIRNHLEIALCFGLTLAVLISIIGPVSGCYLNLAVTLTMLVLNKISFKNAVGYMTSQFFGAVLGAGIIYIISFGDFHYSVIENGLGQNSFPEGNDMKYNVSIAFLFETIFTALFIIVMLFITSDPKNESKAGLIIGFAIVIIHLIGIPITGVSLNPARSFGPAILLGGKALSQLWLFVLAPFIGALLAAFVWSQVELDRKLSRLLNK